MRNSQYAGFFSIIHFMNPRTLTWGESLKISGYNLKYKALSYLEQFSPTQILPNFQNLFILGQMFSANPDNRRAVNELIYKRFINTLYMTYRFGFKELADKQGNSYVTDAGWGCMIRAGQMFIAQILKKHLRLQEKEELFDILKHFDDSDEEAMFSLQNIVKVAKQQYELEPGVWYNPCQISFVVSELFDKHPNNPYRKTLGTIVMNNSSLILEQVLKKMTNKQQLCSCKKELVVCYKCDKKDVAVNVVILTRIGLDAPEKKYLRCLNRIIECPYFQGFIGGKPDKALYFIGKHSNRYIYLDPHVVQPAVSKSNFQTEKESYFCKKFRSCKAADIDPSMGISFYLDTLEELDGFYKWMLSLKEDDTEGFFLFMSVETPEFMKPGYNTEDKLFEIRSDQQGQTPQQKSPEKS